MTAVDTRPACDRGEHFRCADADNTCPCACHTSSPRRAAYRAGVPRGAPRYHFACRCGACTAARSSPAAAAHVAELARLGEHLERILAGSVQPGRRTSL